LITLNRNLWYDLIGKYLTKFMKFIIFLLDFSLLNGVLEWYHP